MSPTPSRPGRQHQQRPATAENAASTASQRTNGHHVEAEAPDAEDQRCMPQRRAKTALTVRIHPDLAARLRRVVRDAAGKPLYETVSSLVERAIKSECDRVEALLAAAYVDPGQPPIKRSRVDTNHVIDRR